MDSIQIFGRTDCCADELSDFYILVSAEDMRGQTLNELLNNPQVWQHYNAGTVYVNQSYAVPTTGRFVRIQRRGSGYLAIAEVEVYGQNLAQGKPATQSSTQEGSAYRAVDGNIDGVFANGSVTHTLGGANEWLQIDMETPHDLGRIWLFNRTDCCLDRFAHFYVFTSNTDMTGQSLAQLKANPKVWQYFEVAGAGSRYLVAAGDARGRYVRVQRNTTGVLSVAEVVIYGVPSQQASTTQLNPAEFGQWSEVIAWPHLPIHASLMPNGKLLTWDATPDDFEAVFDPHSSANDTVRASMWDPQTGQHIDASTDNGVDTFCAGHNHLTNGDLFVAGGTTGYNKAIHATQTYDSFSNQWALGPNLAYPRWYPTVADLAGGEMLIAAGQSNILELYTPWTDSLQSYPGIRIGGSWPIIKQAPDGDIVFAGGDNNDDIYTIDLAGNGTLNPIDTTSPLISGSAHAMYDIGKVLYAGAFNSTTRQSAKVLDLYTKEVVDTDTMNYRRDRLNLTILADGSVMAVGGTYNSGACDMEASSFAGEIWNPVTGQWSVMASQDRPRQHHSTSVLLPDGRVWSGGGGYSTKIATQAAFCAYQASSEIFSPPYLFQADGSMATRPEIEFAPSSVLYDSTFTLTSPDATQIRKVGLVKLSSVTHKNNTGQRYVPLTFNQVNTNKLEITTPQNSNLATSGYYMLFIMNADGTPSVSHMIQLTQNMPPVVTNSSNQSSLINTNITFAINASDPNGEVLSYSATGLPPGLTIDSVTGVVSGSVSVQGRYSVTVMVDNGGSTAQVTFDWTIFHAKEVAGAHLQGYWPFDDDGRDFFGFTNGLLKNGVSVVNDTERGTVLTFDGVDDYLSIPLDISETAATISFWFKTSDDNRGIFSAVRNETGGDGSDRHIYLSNGNIKNRLWNNEVIQSNERQYVNDQWHHVVYTYGPTIDGQKIYVDGEEIASGTKVSSDFYWQQYVLLGRSSDSVNDYFKGSLDDLRVYRRALTAIEVTALLAADTPLNYDYGDAPDSYGTQNASNGPSHMNPGLANLALNKLVTATSWSGDHVPLSPDSSWHPSNLTDGIVTAGQSGWASGNGLAFPQSATIDLGAPTTFNRMVIQASPQDNFNIAGYDLLGSSTGAFSGEEVMISSGTIPSLLAHMSHEVTFASATAQYVRIVGTSSYSNFIVIGELSLFTDGLTLGSTIDSETDGQPSAGADEDNLKNITNVALNGTTTGASSECCGVLWAGTNLFDGVINSTDNYGWAATLGTTTGRDEWVTHDLGAVYILNSFAIQNVLTLTGFNIRDYVLYGSTTGAFAGEEFIISSGTIPSLAAAATHRVNFTPVATRYIKIQGTSGWSGYLLIGELSLFADDEDGITLGGTNLQNQTLNMGQSYDLDVAIVGTGFLNAWIDWNGNGVFDNPSELISRADQSVTTGTAVLNVTVPNNAVASTTYARFRFCADPDECNTPNGAANSGEVEDYQLVISNN